MASSSRRALLGVVQTGVVVHHLRQQPACPAIPSSRYAYRFLILHATSIMAPKVVVIFASNADVTGLMPGTCPAPVRRPDTSCAPNARCNGNRTNLWARERRLSRPSRMYGRAAAGIVVVTVTRNNSEPARARAVTCWMVRDIGSIRVRHRLHRPIVHRANRTPPTLAV